MKLNNQIKIILVLGFLALSFVGFLVKLPSVFRHFDKELHSLFYFAAAAFLNLLFAKRNIIKHVVIFIALYLFSVGIEYAQEYSNKLLHKKIHGRYDVEDIQANVKGLVLFSIVWLVCVGVLFARKHAKFNKVENAEQK